MIVFTLSFSAFFCSLIFLLCKPFNSNLDLIINVDNNLIKYSFCLLFFLLSMLLSVFLYNRGCFSKMENLLNKKVTINKKIFSFIIYFISFFLLMNRLFYSELREFPFYTFENVGVHHLSKSIMIPLITIIFIIVILLIYKKVKINSFCVFAFYFMACSLSFIDTFYFEPTSMDIHHGVAYTESIFNVCYGTPYNQYTTGIYGHYGLFYGLLMKLLSGRSLCLSILISLTMATCTGLCCYLIHHISKNNIVKILGCLVSCITIITLRETNYWQLQPHRVLFVLILAVYVYKRQHVMNDYFGFILLTLAILWNTETGLFLCIAYSSSLLLRTVKYNNWNSRKTILTIANCVIFSLLSLIISITIVNFYNLFCGYKKIELSSFFFPLFNNSYVNDTLKYDMVLDNFAWIYIIFLVAVCFVLSLKPSSLFKKKNDNTILENNCVLMNFLSVITALTFSYYANRAAYFNLDVCMQTSAILMCMITEIFWDHLHFASGYTISDCLNKCLLYITIVALTITASTAITFPFLLKARLENLYEGLLRYTDNTEYIKTNIKEETAVYGLGMSNYFYSIGRDPKIHIRDISDLTIDGDYVIETLKEFLLKQKNFVLVDYAKRAENAISQIDEYMTKNDECRLAKAEEFNGYIFYYYERINN